MNKEQNKLFSSMKSELATAPIEVSNLELVDTSGGDLTPEFRVKGFNHNPKLAKNFKDIDDAISAFNHFIDLAKKRWKPSRDYFYRWHITSSVKDEVNVYADTEKDAIEYINHPDVKWKGKLTYEPIHTVTSYEIHDYDWLHKNNKLEGVLRKLNGHELLGL